MPRNLEVKVVGDTSDYERALKKAGNSTEKFAGLTNKLGKTALLAGGAAGVGALAIGLKKSVAAAMEAEESQKRMEAGLKALGISYGKHKKKIEDVVQSTSKLAGLDDEDLQNAFTRLVRTSGNVNTALTDMKAAANLARGAHISLDAATKALANAEAGRYAGLQRYVGALPKITTEQDKVKAAFDRYKATHKEVSLDEKERVKGLLASARATDKAASAENALDIVQKKFSGSAEAYGKTAAGAQERFHVALENVEEQIGKGLLPLVTKLMNAVTVALNWLEQHWPQITKEFKDFGTQVTPIISGLAAIFDAMWPTIKKAFDVIIPILKDFVQEIKGMIQIVSGLLHGDFGQVWDGLKNVVGGALSAITDEISAIAQIWWSAFGGVFESVFVTPFETAWDKITTWFSDHWQQALIVLFTGIPGVLWVAFSGTIMDKFITPLKNKFDEIKNAIATKVTDWATAVAAFPGKIADFGGALLARIQGFFETAQIGGWIAGKVQEFAGFFAAMPGKIVDFGKELLTKIQGVFDTAGLGTWISGKVDDLAAFFTKLPTKIGQAVKDGVAAGKKLLGEAVDAIFGKLGGWVKDILDIHSPSKEFEKIGTFVIQGMVDGLKSSAFHLKDAILEIVKKYVIDTGFKAFEGWTSEMWDSLSSLSGDVGSFFSDLFGGGPGGVVNGFAVLPELPSTTHETLGLAGYPATDVMLPAGTVVGSPSIGSVTRTSGRPFSEGWSDGPGSAIGLSLYVAGRVADYFLTHFDRLFVGAGASIGRGTPIGTVGPMDAYGVASHIHEGVHRLAAGGIVRKPTFAMVGEAGPEAVIPLSKMRDGRLGGPSTIQVMLDGRVLAEVVRRENGRWSANNGLAPA